MSQNKKSYKKIKSCRICKNSNLKTIIDLGKQHIQGAFINEKNKNKNFKKIPLELVLCPNCSLVQTKYSVNPDELYKNYWYSSGINFTMRKHLKDLSKEKILNLNKKQKILDIGCNDGTLLNCFSNYYFKVGIDPSDLIKKIKNKKIKVINDFFPSKKLLKITKQKKFDVITSIAMFYDIEDPSLFVNQIKKILDEKGIWVFELSYLSDMLKLNSFDTICHEHLEYYSLYTLKYLTDNCDMKIFKIKFNDVNGGSIRCYVTHKQNKKFDNKSNFKIINKYLKKEKNLQISTIKPYRKFYLRIIKFRQQIKKILLKLKKLNKIVHIYGASTKGNTIIQWLGINNKDIAYAADRNFKKWGTRTIGTKIEIISERTSKSMKPQYYLVLPWHFKKEFLKREKKFLNDGGKMIFPLPTIKIY